MRLQQLVKTTLHLRQGLLHLLLRPVKHLVEISVQRQVAQAAPSCCEIVLNC